MSYYLVLTRNRVKTALIIKEYDEVQSIDQF